MDLKFYEHFYSIKTPQIFNAKIFDENLKPINSLKNLSKINVFIGTNNSGKSFFLREAIKADVSSEFHSETIQNEINLKIELTKKYILNIFDTYNKANSFTNASQQLFTKSLIDENVKFLSDSNTLRNLLLKIKEIIDFLHKGEFVSYQSNNMAGALPINAKVRGNILASIQKLNDLVMSLTIKKPIHRIYIPTIRTLRVYGNAILTERTASEYSLDKKNEDSKLKLEVINIENGQKFFEAILDLLTSEIVNQRRVKRFENFLSTEFFNGEEIIINSDQKKRVVNIKIGNEQEQPIHNLGDGLQMLIILTFPLFNYDSGIILIEEPELFLHPGLQKQFINIISKHKISDNFLFLIATHSNHIIEASNYAQNISLFSIEKFFSDTTNNENKRADFKIRNLNYGDKNILNLLGVTNNSVFLSNCTIWVEGITDKLYLRKYIECFLSDKNLDSYYERCKSLIEGIAYSFVYSSGDNIIHYDFSDDTEIKEIAEKNVLKYICGRSFIIVDKDQDKNIKRKEDLKQLLGLRFYILPVNEIENLLSPESIISTIESFPSWSDLSSLSIPLFKTNNYSNKSLGSFIDKTLLPFYEPYRKKFSEKSGTLNCKNEFCDKSLEFITIENMTFESKNVVRQVLDFVLSHNPHI